METNAIAKQMIGFQKTVFDTSFSIMAAFQDHGCEIMKNGFEKSRFVPEGSTKMCTYWMDFLKQNRANCKEYMDNGFNRMNEFFQTADLEAEPVNAAPVKKPAPAKKAAPPKKAAAATKAPAKKAATAKAKASTQKKTPEE